MKKLDIPQVERGDIRLLARIIHEHFYCNRQDAAATSLVARVRRPGGQARPSRPRRTVQVRLGPSGLRVPVSQGVLSVS
ncbi:MAG: hypothetical protein IPP12_18080 [Nitrospira sp.]|nr:hypothetical protein [Nitrospira sp.]